MPRRKTAATEGDTPDTAAQDHQDAPQGAFRVVWDIKVDGRRYAPGSALKLDPERAARLVALGAIHPIA